MKKIYMIAVAVCTAMSMSAADHVALHKMFGHKPKKERKVVVRAENSIWRPATTMVSYWDEDWIEAEEYKSIYDKNGNVLQDVITYLEEDTKNRVSYTYNENNLKTSEITEVSEAGAPYENYQKKTRAYDPIVKTLVVENRDFMWDNGSWSVPGNCWDRTVTRDANGVITEVKVSLPYYDDMPLEGQKNTVGPDGKISGIETGVWDTSSGTPVWVPEQIFTNMIWQETDGQIYDDESFMYGANKVKSLDLRLEDEDGILTGSASWEYNDNGYVLTITSEEEDIPVVVKTTYEEKPNGGYRAVNEQYVTYLGQNIMVLKTEEYSYFDEYGYELESYYSEQEGNDEEPYFERTTGTVEYDPTYGYPLSYTRSYTTSDEEEPIYDVKLVFSDYQNMSGVNNVASDGNAPVEYYTIDGVKTDASAPGIYIRRQGSTVTKILKN